MDTTEQKNYLDLILAIDKFLNFKLNSLDEEASNRSNGNYKFEENALILSCVEKGRFINHLLENAEKQHMALRESLADILETIYQYTVKEKEARGSVHKERMIQLIPEYMATLRHLIEKLNNLKITAVNGNAFEEKCVCDRRLETVLNELEKSTELEKTSDKEYKHRFWHAVLIWVLLFGTTLSALSLVVMKCYDAITEFIHFMTVNSHSPVEPTNICVSVYWQVAHDILVAFFFATVITLICFKIRVMQLKKEIKKGNASARFVYAHYFLIPLVVKFDIDYKKYVYEIMECAKCGYPLALYQLGKMYEDGYYRIVEKNINLSIYCYACASRYLKEAQEKYNVLTKNFN